VKTEREGGSQWEMGGKCGPNRKEKKHRVGERGAGMGFTRRKERGSPLKETSGKKGTVDDNFQERTFAGRGRAGGGLVTKRG